MTNLDLHCDGIQWWVFDRTEIAAGPFATKEQAELGRRVKAAGRGKVNISHVYPPIPTRQFDWCAAFDGDEPNDDGQMLAGYGATKAEALSDLLDRVDEL